MTTSTSAVPSLASLTSLLGKVLKQYESALKEKSISFYPSQVTIVPQEIAGPSKTTTIPWTIRCVPALLEKAKEKVAAKSQDKLPSTDSKRHQQNVDDVFAPPYHPGLLVEELPQHTVLVSACFFRNRIITVSSNLFPLPNQLNKFCVVPRHFLLVTKGERPQMQLCLSRNFY
jgi:ATP adenylyltransferase